jgi:hypothetical protein
MRVTTSRNPNFFHVDYRTFDDAGGVPTFDPTDPVPDVLAALRAAGRQVPPGSGGGDVGEYAGEAPLTLDHPGTIRRLNFQVPAGQLGRARVRMTFDGHRTVDAPLSALRGGPGSLLARGTTLWWPMPFLRRARIEVVGVAGTRIHAEVEVGWLVDALARGEAGYFRATWHAGPTRARRDWTVLDARGPGLLVGVAQTMTGPRSRRFLEGDDRIVADGALLHGTGTEDFYEGAYYFSRGPFSLPLTGNPLHRTTRATDTTAAYRWRLGDAVPFARRLRFTFEHGDRDRVAARYETVALWYGP